MGERDEFAGHIWGQASDRVLELHGAAGCGVDGEPDREQELESERDWKPGRTAGWRRAEGLPRSGPLKALAWGFGEFGWPRSGPALRTAAR